MQLAQLIVRGCSCVPYVKAHLESALHGQCSRLLNSTVNLFLEVAFNKLLVVRVLPLERAPDVQTSGNDYDWPSWLTLGCWSQGKGSTLHVKVGERGFKGKDAPAFAQLLRVVRDVCELDSDALAWI